MSDLNQNVLEDLQIRASENWLVRTVYTALRERSRDGRGCALPHSESETLE